jgi:hypothetical protein
MRHCEAHSARYPRGPEKGWVTLLEKPGLDLEPRDDRLREFIEQ